MTTELQLTNKEIQMNLVRVADIYKEVLGVKKVYFKTVKRDLEKNKVEHLSTKGKNANDEAEFFITSKDSEEKIRAYLKSTPAEKKVSWQHAAEERLGALEEELTKVLVRLQNIERTPKSK